MNIFEELDNDIIISEANIISDRHLNYTIGIYPRDTMMKGYSGDPYFKIYNHQQETSASYCCRISFLQPKYMYHRNDDGKMLAFLSMKEIRTLIEELTAPREITVKSKDLHGHTVPVTYYSLWNALCCTLADATEINRYRSLEMPDYTQLTVDKKRASNIPHTTKTGIFF